MLAPDSRAGLVARLALAAPAAGVAVTLDGLASELSTVLVVLGWLVLLGALALRFGLRRYAADRIVCIFVAFAASLWILEHAVETETWSTSTLAGTLIAALSLIAVQPVARISAVHVPVVANVPGLPPAPEPWTHNRQLDVLALLAVAAGVVLAASGLPGWPWLLLSLVVAARPGLALIWAGRRLLAGRAIERRIDETVADYAPEFYVYTSRPDDASYQIQMWLPYLERTGRRFLIVTRTNVAARAVMAGTSAPVITRRSLASLDRLIVPSLRAVFYVNASSGNGAMVRYQHLTHVYLGHGDSDKPPSYNPTHAMYDKVFCAGPAAIDRYGAHGVDIPRSKFEIVGRPQVEDVRPADSTRVQTVLYAPTWRGHVSETLLYSLPQGERIVRSLLDRGLTVIFRPHPFSDHFPEDAAVVRRIDAMLAADAAATGLRHLHGAEATTQRSIIDCINASDAMVSDVSSVVSDYLFSGKPFALVAVPAPPEQFIRDFPAAAGSYVIDGDLTNLSSVIDSMTGDDPLTEERRAIRNYYLGDFDAVGYSQNFVDGCLRVLDAPPGESGGVDDSVDESRSRASNLVGLARAQVSRFGREIVLSGLATVASVVALAGHPRVGTWIGAVAVLGLLVVSREAVRNRSRLNRMVGTLVLPRLMMLAAAAVIVSSTDLGLGVGASLAVVAIGAVALATAAGLALRPIWTGPGLGVRNLPGLVESGDPRTPPGLAYVVNVGALALIWLLLLLPVSDGWVVVAGAGSTVATVAFLAASVRRASALDRSRSELGERVADYAPRFAVYFGSTVGADYQIGMWLPYFHRIGERFVIITRTMAMLEAVEAMNPGVPVVFRPTLRSLEEVIVPSLTTTFYVNNAVRNTHFIERRELVHIWLNHGDSEKPACFNPVHAIYDKIYAAGQAGIDRYARHGVDIARSKFEIVGRPQVERITRARGPIGSLEGVTVLYAPTWQGPYADSRVYSLPMGAEIVRGLLDRGARVVFRAHPFNYRFPEAVNAIQRIGRLLDADRKATGRQHLWGPAAETALTVEECFNLSDAMIADVSAVVSDYLQSGKPFSIVSVGRTVEDLLAEVPAARAAYVLRGELSNLDEVLLDLLSADPLADERDTTRIYYLGDFPAETYADGFVSAARRIIENPTLP